MKPNDQATFNIDEKGTGQSDAIGELKQFCDRHFSGEVAGAAVALGRTEEEISEMISGETVIDDDLMMKVRGIDQQRSGGGRTGSDRELGASQ